jgi:hypothetical protein
VTEINNGHFRMYTLPTVIIRFEIIHHEIPESPGQGGVTVRCGIDTSSLSSSKRSRHGGTKITSDLTNAITKFSDNRDMTV